MGNAHVKPHPRNRNKKQVHWKAAGSFVKCFGGQRIQSFDLDRPSPPGKPQLLSETEHTPDVVTIRWTRPISDGGSPISGFLVEHRRTGSPHWVRATPLLVPFPEVTLSGLEPGWRYQFRVSAENAVGISNTSEISEPITVTLQRSAVTAPRFEQELADVTALENEKCEFVVHFLGQPAPKVCWFKDGFEIFSSRRIRIITEPDKSILTIHQCSLSDEGEIKCTATNRAGHIATKAKLSIEAPPSIRLPRQYEDGLLFEIGEIIRLKVSVAGRPTPLVFWTHNGETIQNNDRNEIEYKDRTLVLKVGEAQRSDRGEYQIKAVNKLGEDTASFLVTVTDKPSPPGKARVVMTLGRSVTLSWSTPQDDGGCKIGNYIIEYYRLGWNVWLKAATSRQLTTLLGDLIEGSEYKFRVKAESPYGVSEPSEETEVIFIPDAKRGIVKPPPRGKSHPRDFLEEVGSPIATRRKNKSRSDSSSRSEEEPKEFDHNLNINNAGIPKRPERTKIKSPPKTPELSPMVTRKDVSSPVNKSIVDRSSIARELAYGSPEIKVKKELDLPGHYTSSNSDRSKTSSPELNNVGNHKNYLVKIEDTKDKSLARTPSPKPKRSPSPEKIIGNKAMREHHDNISGSSEFMLVLYSDESEKGQSVMFEFDEYSIPPPLSLSAPELGVEPPQFYSLKNAASSTELLHERAMARFYQAAEAEEAELQKRRNTSENRRASLDIPKIQINSRDEEDIVGLDRKHSFGRRLSAGGITQQQAMQVQRRQSLKNSTALKNETNLHKAHASVDIKRDLMMKRQRSNSEELEEEEFKRIRQEMLQSQSSFAKKKISIAEEAKWMEEYEESLSESESESSDDERYKQENMSSRKIMDDDSEIENETYRPMSMRSIKKSEEPFEILTKRKEPPDPNFKPKPILKKTEYEISPPTSPSISPLPSPSLSPPSSPLSKVNNRSHSPIPQSFAQRNRSKSLGGGVLHRLPSIPSNENLNQSNKLSRPRSNSLLPQKDLMKQEIPKLKKGKALSSSHNISALAQMSGIAAASIVIPQNLLDKKKDEEEAKVVADHYADIVKSYGGRRKSNPQLYLDRDTLKNVAENVETPQEEDLAMPAPSKPIPIANYDIYRRSSSSDDRKAVTEKYNSQHDTPQKVISNNDADINQSNRFRRVSTSEQYNLQNDTPQKDITNNDTSLRQGNRFRTVSTSSQYDSKSSVTDKSHQRSDQPSTTRRRSTTSKSPGRRSSVSSSNRTDAKSPARPENWSKLKTSETHRPRKTSPSPKRRELIIKRKSKSPSPIPLAKRRPMLKEIMTQTSEGGFESLSSEYSGSSTPIARYRQEQLTAKAEIKVRSAVDYITDLAMFAVACWLYLFKNELLAIPVLLVMVYRQLKDEVSKRIPNWILKRLKKK